jgi:hypothetical protein
MRKPTVDLDLRIKAGAALTCDLSTRVGAANAIHEIEPSTRLVALALVDEERSWLRRIAYVAFAVAIAIPWVLFLTDQLMP